VTNAELMRAALYGGRAMTVAELSGATGIGRENVKNTLTEDQRRKAGPWFAKVGQRAAVGTGGRPAVVWALASSVKVAVVTADPWDALRAALVGANGLTLTEIAARLKASKTTARRLVSEHADKVICVGRTRSVVERRGGNKGESLFALAGTGSSAKRVELLGPAGPGCGEIRGSEGIPDDDADGDGRSLPTQSGPMSWVTFEVSAETVECPTSGTVKLADCIDGYVDATACERGTPCDSCPIGRQRRAAWAGADFEDSPDEAELDA